MVFSKTPSDKSPVIYLYIQLRMSIYKVDLDINKTMLVNLSEATIQMYSNDL